MKPNFETTHWSLVLDAGGEESGARVALEKLCQAYWFPLYAFIRRQGHDADRARDLTQGYFVNLLETRYLERVDPEAGRFRSFLLVSVKHFLSNQRTRELAQKRRTDDPDFRITFDGVEDRYDPRAARETSAESLFEKRWASTLMARALERLAAEYAATGQAPLHHRLKGFLTGAETTKPYSHVAAEMEMTEGAIKVAVHRMRRRLGVLLRDEVSQTVARPEDVDDELRYLLSIVGD